MAGDFIGILSQGENLGVHDLKVTPFKFKAICSGNEERAEIIENSSRNGTVG